MKQNTIIVLLTAVVVLLAVNLMQGRTPPTAQAAIGSHDYLLECTNSGFCYALDSKANLYQILVNQYQFMGNLRLKKSS